MPALLRRALCGALLGLLATPPAGAADGGFGGFLHPRDMPAHGLRTVTAPVRAGATAQRFELRAGDCSSANAIDDCASDRERIELTSVDRFAMGDDVWLAWSLYLPQDFPDLEPAKVTLGQIHQRGGPRGTAGGRPSRPPLLMFEIRGGVYRLVHHDLFGDPAAVRGTDRVYDLIDVAAMKGRWTDIVLHLHVAGADGAAQVFVDGVAKGGPSHDLVRIVPDHFYFKYGLYRAFVSRYARTHPAPVPTQVVYYDEIRLGATRAAVDRRVDPALPAVD